MGTAIGSRTPTIWTSRTWTWWRFWSRFASECRVCRSFSIGPFPFRCWIRSKWRPSRSATASRTACRSWIRCRVSQRISCCGFCNSWRWLAPTQTSISWMRIIALRWSLQICSRWRTWSCSIGCCLLWRCFARYSLVRSRSFLFVYITMRVWVEVGCWIETVLVLSPKAICEKSVRSDYS